MNVKIITLKVLFLYFSTGYVIADLPFASPKININGKVIDWVYRGAVKYDIKWQSRSTRVNSRAHFLLLIEDDKVDKINIAETNLIVKNIQFLDPFVFKALNDNKDQKNLLVIPLEIDYEKNEILIDTQIIIKDYYIERNGANFTTHYKVFHINKPNISK